MCIKTFLEYKRLFALIQDYLHGAGYFLRS